jgi:hypothetical protein
MNCDDKKHYLIFTLNRPCIMAMCGPAAYLSQQHTATINPPGVKIWSAAPQFGALNAKFPYDKYYMFKFPPKSDT